MEQLLYGDIVDDNCATATHCAPNRTVYYDSVHDNTYTPTCSLGNVRIVSKNE